MKRDKIEKLWPLMAAESKQVTTFASLKRSERTPDAAAGDW